VWESLGDTADGAAGLAVLTDRFTTEAVSRIIGRMFLVTVVGVQPDGTVYVDRGADGGMRVGAVYDVMRPGKELPDQHTGASLGREETRIGSLEVVSVEASRSRARLRDGANPTIGDILRATTPTATTPANVMKPDF
jgi:hypothetical protein